MIQTYFLVSIIYPDNVKKTTRMSNFEVSKFLQTNDVRLFELYYRLTKEQLTKRFGAIKWIHGIPDDGQYVRHAHQRQFGGDSVPLHILLTNGSAEEIIKYYRESDEAKYKKEKFIARATRKSTKNIELVYSNHDDALVDDDGVKKLMLIDFDQEERDADWDWQAEFTYDLIDDTLTITTNPDYRGEISLNVENRKITRQTKFSDLPKKYDLDNQTRKTFHPLIIC